MQSWHEKLAASFVSHNFTYYAGAFTKQPDYLQYAKQQVERGMLHTYIDKVYSVYETKRSNSISAYKPRKWKGCN